MSLKQRLGLEPEPVYLVDGHTLIYRAFYAFPDLSRSDGFPTNALFIVTRMLFRLMREEKPRYLAILLDGKGPSFRREIYEPYKAQRPTMPEPLALQIEPIREVCGLLGFTAIVAEGGEADDCIASLVSRLKAERPVVIVGSDKDLKQCLDKDVVMWDPGLKQEKIVTRESLLEENSVPPEVWADYQALIGDSSDNIPGVPGIGPKTASRIMRDYPNLERIRDNLDQLKPAVRKKLEPHIQEAFTYRKLTRLHTEFCSEVGIGDLRCSRPDPEKVLKFLESYEFRTLLREFRQVMDERYAREKPEDAAEQATAPGEQFGLLSPEPVVEARGAGGVSELPALEGKDVGLVPADGAFHLGLDGEEYHYTGPEAELARAMRRAASVSAPDVKALLRREEAWESLEIRRWFDLALAQYLLSPEDRNYSWERLRDVVARDLLENPAAGQGALAADLGRALGRRLGNAGLFELMKDIEMPLIPVLARMEKRGVALDLEAFSDFLGEVENKLGELTGRIYEAAGEEFNIRSSQQLARILFEKIGLKPRGKTPGGAPSTSVGVLERLQGEHELVDLILEFRRLEKLRSTYLEPMPKLVDGDGRVHTFFNQMATATGRLSSSNPNLQNIPIRGEMGMRMRACFRAAPGSLLVAADYSQIELRVLAHFSREPTLLDAFRKGQDIHSRTAALLFDKPGDSPEKVSGDERRMAKTINFGLIYGMGPQKLSRELGISMQEAKEFIARYFERLSGLARYYEAVEEDARQHGYVTTLTGRRRLLPDIASDNPQEQSAARRQAVNARIQGSAADIIKLAMIHVEDDEELRKLGARLILQVHDELLLEAPEASAEAAGERLAAIMDKVAELDVPLDVEHGVGVNWAEAH